MSIERASALMDIFRYQQAHELLVKVTAAPGADARAWAKLARCELELGHPAAAREAANKALSRDESQRDVTERILQLPRQPN